MYHELYEAHVKACPPRVTLLNTRPQLGILEEAPRGLAYLIIDRLRFPVQASCLSLVRELNTHSIQTHRHTNTWTRTKKLHNGPLKKFRDGRL